MSANALIDLNHQLDGWLRRYRLQRAVRWSLRGAALALGVALVITLIAVLRGLLLQAEFIALAIGLMVIGTISAAAAGYLWRPDRLAAARWFDRHFGLRERVSTALEFAHALSAEQGRAGRADRSSGEIAQRQLQDAVTTAQRVNVNQQLPLKIKRIDAVFTSVLLIAVLIVAWRGESFFQLAAQTRAVQQTIAEEAAKVEALRQQVATDPNLTEAQRQEMLQALQETQQQLKEAQSLEQATSVLTRGEKKFESLTSAQAEAQTEGLRQAGRWLAQDAGSPLQSFGQNLADGDFLAAAEDLHNLDLSQMSASEAAALADQLEQAAEALQSSNPELAQQMRDAADAARSGDAQKAQQALDQAAQSMTQAAQQAARSNVARKVTTQLGQGRQRMIAAGRSAQSQTAQGNQSGQGNPTQPGSGQSGSSSQSNPNGGAGSGAGKGTGDSGDAKGSEAGGKPIDQNNGPGDGGEAPYEPIYAPQRLGGSGDDTVTLPGSGDNSGDVTGQSGVNPGTDTPSQVPYSQVFAQYANAYRQAIDSGQVPPQMKDLIRQYFSSLEP
jgi:hypothetical protein